jgi:hypothetical protein
MMTATCPWFGTATWKQKAERKRGSPSVTKSNVAKDDPKISDDSSPS